jgi:DNA mismatch endonuclease, patch repair protein
MPLQSVEILLIDLLSRHQRSLNMARITGRNTQPELAVRKALRGLGIGYRLHVRSLPGTPDIVMKGRQKIIEVRGCFWHRHPGCKYAYMPKSNIGFWNKKFASNVARDQKNEATLQNGGWDTLVVWECEVNDCKVLQRRLSSFIRRKGKRT